MIFGVFSDRWIEGSRIDYKNVFFFKLKRILLCSSSLLIHKYVLYRKIQKNKISKMKKNNFWCLFSRRNLSPWFQIKCFSPQHTSIIWYLRHWFGIAREREGPNDSVREREGRVMARDSEKERGEWERAKMSVRDRVIMRGSERGREWSEIARKNENEREGPSDRARKRKGPCDGQR